MRAHSKYRLQKMIILGIHVRKLSIAPDTILTKSSIEPFSLTTYLIFFLCGEVEMMVGCSMHSVAMMSEHVSLDAVAVRAMTLTSEGISALTSPSRLYSGRNDSPRYIKIIFSIIAKVIFIKRACG